MDLNKIYCKKIQDICQIKCAYVVNICFFPLQYLQYPLVNLRANLLYYSKVALGLIPIKLWSLTSSTLISTVCTKKFDIYTHTLYKPVFIFVYKRLKLLDL